MYYVKVESKLIQTAVKTIDIRVGYRYVDNQLVFLFYNTKVYNGLFLRGYDDRVRFSRY